MTQNITDVSTYTDPIVAPSPLEPATAASIVQPIQGLANRTFYLKGQVDTHDTVLQQVADALSGGPAATRRKFLNLAKCFAQQNWQPFSGVSGILQTNNAFASGKITVPIELASGSVLTACHFILTPSAGGDMSVALIRKTAFGVETPAAPTIAAVASGSTSGTGLQVPTLSVSETIDETTKEYQLEIVSGSSSDSASQTLWGLAIDYTDNGPRNY